MKMEDDILFIPSKEIPDFSIQLSGGNWRVTVSQEWKNYRQIQKYFVTKINWQKSLLERINVVSKIVIS